MSKFLKRLENATFHFLAAFSTFFLGLSDPYARLENDRNAQYIPLVSPSRYLQQVLNLVFYQGSAGFRARRTTVQEDVKLS